MTTQMIVRIDMLLKSKLAGLARGEGKTTSQKIRELIEDYIKDRDISATIGDLWNRIGRDLKTAGAKSSDVAKAIRAVRKTK